MPPLAQLGSFGRKPGSAAPHCQELSKRKLPWAMVKTWVSSRVRPVLRSPSPKSGRWVRRPPHCAGRQPEVLPGSPPFLTPLLLRDLAQPDSFQKKDLAVLFGLPTDAHELGTILSLFQS